MARYEITNLTELQAMNSHLSDECFLMNDIDASASATMNPSGQDYLGFDPIGSRALYGAFLGSLQGNLGVKYTISNLYINRAVGGVNGYNGLFGWIGASANKVTNGTFNTTSDPWVVGTGWSWVNAANDYMQLSAAGSQGTLSQASGDMLTPIVAGETYILTYTISNHSVGTITPSCGGKTLVPQSGNVTAYAEQFTATSTAALTFTPSSDPVDTANLRIDNVTLFRVRNFKDFSITNATIASGIQAGILCNELLSGSTSYTVIDNVDTNGTITGTTVNGVYAGFIADLDYCTIKNCTSSGAIVTSGTGAGGQKRGGFLGQHNYSIVTNCSSSVSILDSFVGTAVGNGNYFGGFCAYEQTALTVFSYCHASGSIVSTTSNSCYGGGFAGYSAYSTFSKCYSTGDVDFQYATAISSNAMYIGGFSGPVTTGTVTDCYSRCDVCSKGFIGTSYSYIGGFSGSCGVGSGDVTNCYSTGYVNPNAQYSGGFFGSKAAGATITSCYWDTETSRMTNGVGSGLSTGIIGKNTTEMKTRATFAGWDFLTIWEILNLTQPAVGQSNLTVWLSETNNYDDFEEGTKDADSFQTTIPSTNEIQWIDSQEALLIGTAGDEWKLASNKLDTPLSPTNHGSKRQSGHGSAYLQAINVNEVILFIDSVRRKVREMAFDTSTDKYMCPDMTSLSEHITAGQIKWMAYQKNPNSILWVGLDTGDVRGFVYDREQNVTAWFKVPLGGDGVCQSGCVIPGETEDEIYLIVNRSIAGSFVYAGTEQVYAGDEPVIIGGGDRVYLERFSARELTVKADAFFVDCGVAWETAGDYIDQDVYAGTQQVYAGTEPVIKTDFDSTAPSSTVTGLDHLEGETVKILADGVVADDAVVSNGQVTIQIGGVTTTALKANVGLAYTSTLKPMRLVLGDSMGKKTRVNSLVISLLDTGACKYGPDSTDQKDVDLAEIGLTNTSEITGLFTGETEVSQSAGFDPLNAIVITSDKPLPLTIRAIIADLDRTG
jgi:hypothetical protein